MFFPGLSFVLFKACEFHTLTLNCSGAVGVWTSHMTKNSSRRMLKHSCEWIRNNWNATNLDVPPEFVHKWIYEPEDEDTKPTGFFLGVFGFGYLQHQLISKSVPAGTMVSVRSARLLEHFQLWQLKLAMAEIQRVTDVRVSPMPLFDFPDGEEIEYWRVPWEKPSSMDS
jgi:hypothetical protein